MTPKPSGCAFTLCTLAALCADTAPVWLLLALVGAAGLVALVWGVMGFAGSRNLQKFQGSELALKMEEAVAEKAKANCSAGAATKNLMEQNRVCRNQKTRFPPFTPMKPWRRWPGYRIKKRPSPVLRAPRTARRNRNVRKTTIPPLLYAVLGGNASMSNEFLKRLFWACSDTGRHMEVGLNLGELYERDSKTKVAASAMSTAIYGLGLTIQEKSDLETLSVDVADTHEEQGFINGFRLGMKLAHELGAVEE